MIKYIKLIQLRCWEMTVMAKITYRFVDICNAAAIPPSRALSSGEEAEILAQYKTQLDPAQIEAECKELLRLHEAGKLVGVESLPEEWRQLEVEDQKESA